MTRLTKVIAGSVCLLMGAGLAGCSMMPMDDGSYAPPPPVEVMYAPPADGTIYRAETDMRLFEDLKANRVGDILTVRLAERTNASKASQTSTSKATEATLVNPTVFGRPITKNGDPLFGGSLSGDSTFEGSGESSQSNSLVGDITVTVVDRHPNGNLVIRGEKWLTLNQGREFIRVSGIIRPRDIETDNTVLSTRISNAQITYSSKGVLADANTMGWLARFFNSVLSPY
ncbi:MAG: flagellar basal body L-ring protein FlgH [Woeseiaceae bacterium]|nr:flagellar basal body L-ring protein FlgH [Woeseiaceae bacterium]